MSIVDPIAALDAHTDGRDWYLIRSDMAGDVISAPLGAIAGPPDPAFSTATWPRAPRSTHRPPLPQRSRGPSQAHW